MLVLGKKYMHKQYKSDLGFLLCICIINWRKHSAPGSELQILIARSLLELVPTMPGEGIAHRVGGGDGGGGEMPCYMWEQNVALNPGCYRVLLRSWHCMVPRWGQAWSMRSWSWRRCSRQALLLRGVHGQMLWFGAVWGCQSALLGLLKGHSPWPLWVIMYCWNTWRLCTQQSLRK